jgi:hypothetical protein
MLLAGALVVGCGTQQRTLSINDVKLSEKDLHDWKLKEETTATPKNAAPKSIVKALYEAGAMTILNQVFVKDGRTLQVNYVQMKDGKDAERAEAMLEAAVNGTNYIGSKENLAIEIIGTMPDTSLAAQELGLSL